jgi:ribonuclease HII
VQEIDRINILQASLLAMKRAVEGLPEIPSLALVDGKHAPQLACRVDTVIGGDALVEAISAASIIAKVARDKEMIEMDYRYPGYGLARHKGYPTKQHLEELQNLGVTPIHRRSFAPVKRILG